ncbi:MAG TPA: hydroxyacid dehydrogenase [Clostridia bacterium]|nr:hydroxyacid dehydrogenase [Clostridia bacterium]
MKIVVTELIWPEGLEILAQIGQVTYDPDLWRREELLEAISDADGLIVRNQTRVTRNLLLSAPHIKVIGRLGVGLDNIDLDATREKGIPVVFARNCNAISVAEYVFASILSFARCPLEATSDVKKGNWDRRRFTGMELFGKILGLVGVGEISTRLAMRAKAFGMDILGYDPFLPPYELANTDFQVKMVSLEELMSQSDFVSLHIPFNQATHHLINRQSIQLMKSTAYIINSSRGGIIDEKSLYEALVSRRIAGAALDVFEKEPPEGSPLLSLDNVILTPHIAGLTKEAQVKTSVLVARETVKVLRAQQSLCIAQ